MGTGFSVYTGRRPSHAHTSSVTISNKSSQDAHTENSSSRRNMLKRIFHRNGNTSTSTSTTGAHGDDAQNNAKVGRKMKKLASKVLAPFTKQHKETKKSNNDQAAPVHHAQAITSRDDEPVRISHKLSYALFKELPTLPQVPQEDNTLSQELDSPAHVSIDDDCAHWKQLDIPELPRFDSTQSITSGYLSPQQTTTEATTHPYINLRASSSCPAMAVLSSLKPQLKQDIILEFTRQYNSSSILPPQTQDMEDTISDPDSVCSVSSLSHHQNPLS